MRIALALILLAACGDDSSATVDAPTPIDAAVDAKPDSPPPSANGMLSVVETLSGGNADSDVDVMFTSGPVWGTMVGSDGSCVAYEDPPMEGLSAGIVTITGTTSPITATPTGAAPNVTYDTTTPANLFDPGATISVQAAGGADVGAFTASAVAPASVTGFTPPATLNRTNGTTLTWTAGSGPKMLVAFFGFSTQHIRVVLCRVNDTGSYTLSASNLALMPAASTTNNGAFLSLGRLAETTVGKIDLLVMSNIGSEVTFSP